MPEAVRECRGCGRDFAQERRAGRPREYCGGCRPGDNAPVPSDPDWRAEVSSLSTEADALDREADQLAVVVRAKHAEAAKLRARADRIAGAVEGAAVRRRESALDRVRGDDLLAAAGLASEDLPAGFVGRDLAAVLGIADVKRAERLLAALEQLEKVHRHGDGWATTDPDEAAVRDYVVANPEGAIGDVIVALGLPELAVAYYVERLAVRGVVESAGGFYRYREVPNDAPRTRPRRRPPELDPPAGTDAPKRGEPVFIEDHGQNAAPGGKHRAKLKRLARERQEDAVQRRAAEQRKRANGR
jgi:hypothetical protein